MESRSLKNEVMEMENVNGNGNGNGTLSRTCYIRGVGWKRVRLEPEEAWTIEEAVSRKNIETMKNCLKDTFKVVPEDCFDANARMQIAVAFFEAMRLHAYTIQKDALDTKVFEMKEKAKEAQASQLSQ